MLDWGLIVRRVIKLIDPQGNAYLSGGQFIKMMQEVDSDLPGYTEFIEDRNRRNKSTTRRDFFRDILLDMNEGRRIRAVGLLLEHTQSVLPDDSASIRALLAGATAAPNAEIPVELWSGERLNRYLQNIDEAITLGNFSHSVTLSYSCLEGFYGAFLRSKEQRDKYPNEIIDLSKEAKAILKRTMADYPDEVLNGITNAANAVDKSRNRFSQSHFAGEAGRWLAVYIRDLVNTQIRLLRHFM